MISASSRRVSDKDSIFDALSQILVVDAAKIIPTVQVPEGFIPAKNRFGVPYEMYFVSQEGAIGSTNTVRRGAFYVTQFHVLACKQKGPYLNVKCHVDGKVTVEQVHCLVARSWLGMPPEGEWHVNHKDGNKRNNIAPNLEWTTRKGNAEHASQNDLVAFGEDLPHTKITEEEVRSIRLLCSKGWKQHTVAGLFGVTQTNVSCIVNRQTWRRVA